MAVLEEPPQEASGQDVGSSTEWASPPHSLLGSPSKSAAGSHPASCEKAGTANRHSLGSCDVPEEVPSSIFAMPAPVSRRNRLSTGTKGRDSIRSSKDAQETSGHMPVLKKSGSMMSLGQVEWHNPLARYRRQNTGLSQVTKDSTIPSALASADGLRSDSVCPVFAKVESLFRFQEKLGEGSFGTVWRVKHRETGQSFAIKSIDLINEKSIESAGQELNMIKRLSNPYIVRLHHIVQEEGHLYLVIDFCSGGDLCQYLEAYWEHPDRCHQKELLECMGAPMGLPPETIGPWAWQMLVAVAYLHCNRIIHRDIKAANFMLKEDREDSPLQLIDFGYAATYRRTEFMSRQVGTARYMAPEVIEASYTEKYDIWSVGVVLFLLALNKYPFIGTSVAEIVTNIDKGFRQDDERDWVSVPKGLSTLIEMMLTRDFQRRPSAKHLLAGNAWLRQKGRPRKGGQPCCSIS